MSSTLPTGATRFVGRGATATLAAAALLAAAGFAVGALASWQVDAESARAASAGRPFESTRMLATILDGGRLLLLGGAAIAGVGAVAACAAGLVGMADPVSRRGLVALLVGAGTGVTLYLLAQLGILGSARGGVEPLLFFSMAAAAATLVAAHRGALLLVGASAVAIGLRAWLGVGIDTSLPPQSAAEHALAAVALLLLAAALALPSLEASRIRPRHAAVSIEQDRA